MDEIVTTILTQANETFIGESTTAIPKALVEFFIVFGSFFIPCLLGSIISHFIKREKVVKQSMAEHKRVPKVNKKKAILGIVISAILPTIVMSALYDVLQKRVNNGVVLMAVAALFGAIGDDLRKILTLRGIVAIIKVITNGITTIGQLEDVISNSDDDPVDSVKEKSNTMSAENQNDADNTNDTNNSGISQESADAGPPDNTNETNDDTV